MRVTIEYWAVLADRIGTRSEVRQLDQNCTVADLLSLLAEQHEAVSTLQHAIAIAVNDEWTDASHSLAEGDTLALIPPVSGG